MSDEPKSYELIEKEVEDILSQAPKPLRLSQSKIEQTQKEASELASNIGIHSNEKTLENIVNVALQQFSQYQRENVFVIEAHKKAINFLLKQLKQR